jgi:alanine racemase
VERATLKSRPVKALVDASALRHNARVVRRLAPGRQIFAAIKANGYGHGAQFVANELTTEVDGFAVIETEIATQIRLRGYAGPILILEGFYESTELDTFAAFDFEAVVHSAEQVDWISSHRGRLLKVWLKVDTGMNRLGLSAAQLNSAIARLLVKKNVKLSGVMSHLADVDDTESVRRQISKFEALELPFGLLRSLSSSGAVLRYPAAHMHWVRPGLMLYGASPFSDSSGADWGLRPAMTFHSRVISVLDIAQGEAVGYGGTFIAPSSIRVANVAGGYADGYPLSAKTGTPILVDGLLTRTLGRISMDKMCVDVSGMSEVQIGSEVIFWGPDLPVETVARAVNSSPYELLTGISSRVQMEYA